MALLWDASLTDVGVSMISQWAQGTGNKLTITGAVIGEGVVAATQLHTLTQLTDQKSTISIQGFESVANGVKLKLRKTSQGITTSFILNQIGIYAKLDTSGGTPIIADSLIAVYQQDTGVLVPTEADSPDFVFTFYGTVQTNYQGDLTINVDTSAILSQDDIADNLVTADATMALSANMGLKIADNLAANEKSGAKNLMPFPYEDGMSKTFRGVTYTVASDGSVASANTATSDGWFSFASNATFDAGDYKLSGCPSGGSNSTYYIRISITRYGGASDSVYDTGNGATFTLNDGDVMNTIYIGASNGTNMDGLTFKPMIYDARILNPTYVPPAETNLQLTRKTSGLSNENLLDNGWFTVNQRNATAISSGYGADRWKDTSGTTVTFGSGGVTFGSTAAQIDQPLESILPNGTYTASVLLSDGTIISGTATKTSDSVNTLFYNTASLTLFYRYNTQAFAIYSASAKTIRAVKLEVGSISTLANDVEPNYTMELLKCQRYFVAVNAPSDGLIGFGNPNSATTIFAGVPLSTPMRANPNVSSIGTANVIQGGTANAITNVTFNVLSSNYVQLVFTSSGMTVGAIGSIKAAGGGYSLYLSADL